MKNSAQLIEGAFRYHQAGLLPEAEQAYLDILKADKRNAHALWLLGTLYLQTNQPERSVECLERALRLEPDNPEILNNIGLALRALGRLDDAKAKYEKAVRVNPHHVQALNNLGSLFYELGNWSEAVRWAERALTVNPKDASAHYNLGNALRAQEKRSDAIAHYEHALHLQPNYVDALVNLGITLCAEDRPDEAIAQFQQALHLVPDHLQALNNLANALRDKGRFEEAVSLYERVLKLKPDYPEALMNFGVALRDQGKAQEAIQTYEQALRMKPGLAEALVNTGVALQDLGRWEEAVVKHEEALALKAHLVDAQWNMALALLALGRYPEGWALYESGLSKKNKRPAVFTTKKWDGSVFSGKRLLIWCEQGLGDSLQFIRYVPMCKAKGGKVVVLCPQPLARLFRNTTGVDEVVGAIHESDFDYQIAMMSLPYVFGTTRDTIPADIPYVHVSHEARGKWAPQFLGSKQFRVGLVWAGNPVEHVVQAHLIDQRRSLKLSQMMPILDTRDVQFYSLQMGKAAGQIDELGFRDKIVDLMPAVHDLMDTAAIIENLDLVISVDTSVVHLAGALGKPVWVLSRFDACWRWLQNHETNPWYPTARVFGQSSPGDWETVIGQVAGALHRAV